MGRPKKSIDVILEEGKSHFDKETIEQRKEQEAAVRPSDNKTDCPDWLTDKVARKEYRRIAKELNNINLLTNLDITTLAQYCQAYSLYLSATKELEGKPMVIEQTNKSGFTNLIEHPLIRIQFKYSDEMKKHATQMGLTISSRLKLVVPKKDDAPKNKFDEFLDD
ncbi:phage terminase small subunit P27 family [Paenibacillus sp. sgz302251]|uniref:phage terminase small subunit P27 family n=1 Tax=Paenibacillus sp. sgz302251 TaxID=3414493 RepID=UPI003C7BD432